MSDPVDRERDEDDEAAQPLDAFMLGVLSRQHYEETHDRRVDYLLALDWVLDGWRQQDDPVRKHLTMIATAIADAIDVELGASDV